MLFGRLKKLDGDHLRIAKGALRVAFFLFIGKIAGALKEVAVANRYGVSEVTDAYQFTMTMSTWLPATLVGVLSIVLILALLSCDMTRSRAATLYLPKQGMALIDRGGT